MRRSLSSRLLLLTICFVMVVEVFVYVPSIAQYRRSFLEQRMVAAQIAALSLLEAPGQAISRDLEQSLLRAAGVKAVSLRLEDRSQLMLEGAAPSQIDGFYDLRDPEAFDLIRDAITALTRGGKGTIQVVGQPSDRLGEEIAILLEEKDLFQAMARYSRNVLLLSIIISLFTAMLVFFSLNWFMVKPMQRITRSMIEFRKHPDAPVQILAPTGRLDELGIAEQELARMQEELRQALNQRKRLANLGAAVSKVNHDLRNILATAQLSSDRLLLIEDPQIRELSKRLISSIDRAIDLCERTLKYGRADEPPPNKQMFSLPDLIDDVRTALGLDVEESPVRLHNDLPQGYQLYADADHMFRVFMNLCRNAVDAFEGGEGLIRINAEQTETSHQIRVADDGPGIPERAKENLFIPFKGSTGKQGTGLGLAIVAELVEANGGRITLERSDSFGTTFLIELPVRSDQVA